MDKFPVYPTLGPQDDGFSHVPNCVECEDTGEKAVWDGEFFSHYEPCDCQPAEE